MRIAFALAALLLSGTALAESAVETPKAVCARLAAHPLDVENPPDVAGVYTYLLDEDAALAPCKAALAADPDSAQLTAMLGRVRHVRREFTEAKRLYRLAAEQGLAVAKLRLVALGDTYGFDAEAVEAEAWAKAARDAYLPAAQAGDPRAMEALGWIAALDPDGPDNKTTIDWAMRALKEGRVDAVYPISLLRLSSDEISDDVLASVEAAAETGSPLAMRVFGRLLSDREDFAAAAIWYERAWEAGDTKSLHHLAYLYKNDLEDDALAAKWERIRSQEFGGSWPVYIARDFARMGKWAEAAAVLEQAARESENVEAMVALAELLAKYSSWRSYQDDAPTRPVNIEQSAYWALRAAELGSADGAYLASRAYLSGRGVPQNAKKFLYWLRKAAEKDDIYALIDLGDMYSRGSRVGSEKILDANRRMALYYYLRVSTDTGAEPAITDMVDDAIAAMGFDLDDPDTESGEDGSSEQPSGAE